MPPTLRKRKAPAAPPAPPPARKKSSKAKPAEKVGKVVEKAVEKVADKLEEKTEPPVEEKKTNGTSKTVSTGPPTKGDTITLDGFGGEVETNDGKKTTLKDLVEESKAGVVLFTYPKASTPGCTKQVCFFRDSYESLAKTGLLIFGLSADSTKANTTFKTKQKLTYPLLCDPKRTLISAIGLKKAPSGTQRGVFVVDKTGKVLAAESGSPQGTVDVVKAIVETMDAPEEAKEEEKPAGELNGTSEKKDEAEEEKKEVTEESKAEEKDEKADETTDKKE